VRSGAKGSQEDSNSLAHRPPRLGLASESLSRSPSYGSLSPVSTQVTPSRQIAAPPLRMVSWSPQKTPATSRSDATLLAQGTSEPSSPLANAGGRIAHARLQAQQSEDEEPLSPAISEADSRSHSPTRAFFRQGSWTSLNARGSAGSPSAKAETPQVMPFQDVARRSSSSTKHAQLQISPKHKWTSKSSPTSPTNSKVSQTSLMESASSGNLPSEIRELQQLMGSSRSEPRFPKPAAVVQRGISPTGATQASGRFSKDLSSLSPTALRQGSGVSLLPLESPVEIAETDSLASRMDALCAFGLPRQEATVTVSMHDDDYIADTILLSQPIPATTQASTASPRLLECRSAVTMRSSGLSGPAPDKSTPVAAAGNVTQLYQQSPKPVEWKDGATVRLSPKPIKDSSGASSQSQSPRAAMRASGPGLSVVMVESSQVVDISSSQSVPADVPPEVVESIQEVDVVPSYQTLPPDIPTEWVPRPERRRRVLITADGESPREKLPSTRGTAKSQPQKGSPGDLLQRSRMLKLALEDSRSFNAYKKVKKVICHPHSGCAYCNGKCGATPGAPGDCNNIDPGEGMTTRFHLQDTLYNMRRQGTSSTQPTTPTVSECCSDAYHFSGLSGSSCKDSQTDLGTSDTDDDKEDEYDPRNDVLLKAILSNKHDSEAQLLETISSLEQGTSEAVEFGGARHPTTLGSTRSLEIARRKAKLLQAVEARIAEYEALNKKRGTLLIQIAFQDGMAPPGLLEIPQFVTQYSHCPSNPCDDPHLILDLEKFTASFSLHAEHDHFKHLRKVADESGNWWADKCLEMANKGANNNSRKARLAQLNGEKLDDSHRLEHGQLRNIFLVVKGSGTDLSTPKMKELVSILNDRMAEFVLQEAQKGEQEDKKVAETSQIPPVGPASKTAAKIDKLISDTIQEGCPDCHPKLEMSRIIVKNLYHLDSERRRLAAREKRLAKKGANGFAGVCVQAKPAESPAE